MPEVIIIGGGFSGLAMAIQLRRRLGMQDFLLIERSSALGGVWANNRYPGAACDIPTAFYSLSFAQQYWKDLFADGSTIRDYAERIASHWHVLESNTVFQSEVTEARWDADKDRWRVQVRDVSAKSNKESSCTIEYTCKVLVSAVGNLTIPNELSVPGKETFQGPIVHTGAYDESLNVAGKKVVILGNGCTAQQLATTIAPHVQTLTIFGPSKHWYLPRPTLPAPWLFDLLCKYTITGRKLLRFALFAACEDGFRAMHCESGRAYRAKQEKVSREFVDRTVPAKHRGKLTPTFAFGSKRVVFDNGFLASLNRPNVEYIGEHVKEIVPRGVVCQDGTIVEADIILAATGFQAQEYLHSLKIIGQEGKHLGEHMRRDGRGLVSYKGTFYSAFPNFCTLYGPNMGTGHSSAIFTQECQVDMVLKHMIGPVLEEEDVDSVVVKPEKEAEWFEWLRREMKQTVWEQEQAGSWYNDKKGYCTTLYPRGQIHLWWSMLRTSSRDFIYMPRDSKTLYGSTKEMEMISAAVLLLILVVLVILLSR